MLGGFFWGCGNLTRSDFEEDLCVPMKLKKDIGTMITAKMKFLLGYKMIIVGGEGYETLVGNKNFLEGACWGRLFQPGGGRMSKFLASGKNPLPIFLRGRLPPVAKTLVDVVRHAQASYISRMCCFFCLCLDIHKYIFI